jgi:hypothetical protein
MSIWINVNEWTLPICPECGQTPTEVSIACGVQVHDPTARGGLGGTAVGIDDETSWAMSPWATHKPAPDFDVITVNPCGHELRQAVMADYRAALRASRPPSE